MGPLSEKRVIVITGASGYIGAASVAEARRRGHTVRAVVRSAGAAPADWAGDPEISVAAIDLADPNATSRLAKVLAGADAVIHAAARLSGRDEDHTRDTVLATEALLTSVAECQGHEPPQVVLVSSLSVYGVAHLPDGATIDEATPLETNARGRDAYCRAKLQQEQVARNAAAAHGLEIRILRVGAIFGPGRLWNAHFGPAIGSVLFRIGGDGEVPTCHIDRCAAALLLAAERPLLHDDRREQGRRGRVEIINVVDQDRPTRRAYLDALGLTPFAKTEIPVDLRLFTMIARLAELLRIDSNMPGLLRLPNLAARLKPLRYADTRLAARLPGLPAEPFLDALLDAAAQGDPPSRVASRSLPPSESAAVAPSTAAAPLSTETDTSALPKIAYLTGEYPRATDTFIQREVMALRRQGLDVITCSIRRTPPIHHVGPEQRMEAAHTFNVLPASLKLISSLPIHVRTLVRDPLRYFRTLGLALSTCPPGLKALAYQLVYFYESVVLAEHLRQSGATHLHNHIATSSCTVAMLASSVSGIPYSFTLHGPDDFFEPIRWRLDSKIAHAAFVSCISYFCRSQAMVFSAPEHWGKLHIVHCGIDPNKYRRLTRGHRADPTRFRLLFVGRLAPVKGLPILLSALADLVAGGANLHLTIIGDGPDRKALQNDVRERGLEGAVHFAGYKSQDEVAQTLGDVDALVLPSFAEGLPVVLMEALAAGLPVIATRIAGVSELVEHGESGLLVPAGSAAHLASAIAELMSDPTRCQRMGEAGRRLVAKDFASDREAQRLAHLFTAYAGGDTRNVAIRPGETGAIGNAQARLEVVRPLHDGERGQIQFGSQRH